MPSTETVHKDPVAGGETAETDEPETDEKAERHTELVVRAPHHLPLWTRVMLYIVGILFVLLGIAGLFLPILQGVLFLLVGAAILSVASEAVHDAMYRLLHRRPKLWGRVHRFRKRVHDRLSRHRTRPPDR